MLDLSNEDKKKLVEAYKAFYNKITQDSDTVLTLEEKKAVGQKILDDLFAKAFTNLEIPENERAARKKEIEDLLENECPELLSDTSLEFTGERFAQTEHKKAYSGFLARLFGFFRSE